jgi:hypothetical protein
LLSRKRGTVERNHGTRVEDANLQQEQMACAMKEKSQLWLTTPSSKTVIPLSKSLMPNLLPTGDRKTKFM